jgi:uncharacterized membrane protein YeaQ/YmgE (transglycosylase-associated protein family)
MTQKGKTPSQGETGCFNEKEAKMYISGEGLLIILLVGLIAGWLAGEIVAGGGFGIIADTAIGIVGALIGTAAMGRAAADQCLLVAS